MKTNSIGTKGIAIGIMTVLALSFLVGAISTMPTVGASDPSQPIITVYPAHGAVRINNDTGFNATNGFSSGSGTSGDPWVMENLNIFNETNFCNVYIGNTTDYFEINNCEFNDSSATGVYLRNVTHAKIQDCNITNAVYGIFADFNSSDVTISGNLVTECDTGIGGQGVTDFMIVGNDVSDGTLGRAIGIWGTVGKLTDNITITANTIENCTIGIGAYDIDEDAGDGGISIVGNDISIASIYAITLDYGDDAYVMGNTIYDSGIGLYIYHSYNITAFENSYTNLTDDGIFTDESNHLILTKNNMTLIGNECIDINMGEDITIQWFSFTDVNNLTDIDDVNELNMYNAVISNNTGEGMQFVDCTNITLSDMTFELLYDDTILAINGTYFDISTVNGTNTDGVMFTFDNVTESEVSYCSVDNTTGFMLLDNSTVIEIHHNDINNTFIGVGMMNCDDIEIHHLDIDMSGMGIMGMSATNLSIYANWFDTLGIGIAGFGFNNSVISTCNFTNMIAGSIYLNTTDNITILANDFLLCNTTHLNMVSVTNGLIYLNYFYDATYGDVHDDGANDYDNGTVGNYWCNYTGVSNDGDYYGDTPYVNGDGVTDNYPIVLTMNNNSVAGLADILMEFLPVLITVMIVIMMLNFISKMFKNIGKKQ